MTERRHTPGPWRKGEGDPATENLVANVRGIEVWGSYAAVSCRDDANLVAAAPDLLAMAEAFSDLDGHGPNCEVCCNGEYCPRRDALYERVHELHEIAIAKATKGEDAL